MLRLLPWLFVASRLFHHGADAVGAFEAHDALVHAESGHVVAKWDGAMQRQAGVVQAMPLASVAAVKHFARPVDDRQQAVAAGVEIERGDLRLRQVRVHLLPGSTLLLAEQALRRGDKQVRLVIDRNAGDQGYRQALLNVEVLTTVRRDEQRCISRSRYHAVSRTHFQEGLLP